MNGAPPAQHAAVAAAQHSTHLPPLDASGVPTHVSYGHAAAAHAAYAQQQHAAAAAVHGAHAVGARGAHSLGHPQMRGQRVTGARWEKAVLSVGDPLPPGSPSGLVRRRKEEADPS